jgi:hypothetical protein
MEKRDYPEFVGVEILLHKRTTSKKAVIIGCDYHIGFTIVSATDNDDYLCCGHGPMSPKYSVQYKEDSTCIEEWDRVFEHAVGQFAEGVYDLNEADRLLDPMADYGSAPSASNCAFGQ